MKRILVMFVLSILAIPAFSAGKAKMQVERPDMDKIRREVNDPKSRYYYPKLMERYEKNDTVGMTLQDYRHLYLGMIFQEDYNPYRKTEYDHKVEELYYKTQHTRQELDSIDKYAHLALLDDPFDLSQINFLIYALRKRGKNNLANIWQYRLNHLIEAILSTGTGLDHDNAWIIIDPKHEYNIVNFRNAVVSRVDFEQPFYDNITVFYDDPKASDKLPGNFYFDVRYILEEYNRKFPADD